MRRDRPATRTWGAPTPWDRVADLQGGLVCGQHGVQHAHLTNCHGHHRHDSADHQRPPAAHARRPPRDTHDGGRGHLRRDLSQLVAGPHADDLDTVIPNAVEGMCGVAEFDRVVRERRSIRLFHPDQAVPRSDVVEALELARRAPSNSNTQPWHLVFAEGPARERLVTALLDAVTHARARDTTTAS